MSSLKCCVVKLAGIPSYQLKQLQSAVTSVIIGQFNRLPHTYLEAAHHKFQRRLLGITRRDKVRNEDIRKKTGSRKLEDIIKERRLRWLGHVLRMDNSRTARQATHWELRGYKRKPGQSRKNWVDVIKRDLRQMDLTWEEAEELANDKAEWRRRVAQCSHLDAG